MLNLELHLPLNAAGDFCVTCATGSSWIVLCDQNHSGSDFPLGSTLQSHTPLECTSSFLSHRLQLMMLWHVPCSRSAARAVLAPEGLQPAVHPTGSGARTVGTEQMQFISAGQRLTHQSAGWKKWRRQEHALQHLLFLIMLFFDPLML